MKECIKCGGVIPQERIDFFAADGRVCRVCVNCSTVEKVFALQIYEHKTAGYTVVLPQRNGKTDPETKRQAIRAYNRER